MSGIYMKFINLPAETSGCEAGSLKNFTDDIKKHLESTDYC